MTVLLAKVKGRRPPEQEITNGKFPCVMHSLWINHIVVYPVSFPAVASPTLVTELWKTASKITHAVKGISTAFAFKLAKLVTNLAQHCAWRSNLCAACHARFLLSKYPSWIDMIWCLILATIVSSVSTILFKCCHAFWTYSPFSSISFGKQHAFVITSQTSFSWPLLAAWYHRQIMSLITRGARGLLASLCWLNP